MSINFSQFPTPRLPLQTGDFVVGYQIVNGVPTLAQYSLLQLILNPPSGAILPVANGGTGLATLPAGGVLIGNGTNAPNFAAPGAIGQMLISAGPGVPPIFGNNPVITGGTISTGATVHVTTQNPIENTTLAASDAFVNQQIIRNSATVPLNITGGTYSSATLGTGLQVVVFASSGVVTSILTIAVAGTGYAIGDTVVLNGGNFDARIVVTAIGAGGSVTTTQVLYGGTGYTTSLQVSGAEIPPGERMIVLTGALTSNVTYILSAGNYNDHSRRPVFVNNTTGAFTVTVKLSNGAGGTVGTGVLLPQGSNNSTSVALETDGEHDVWIANTPAGIGAVALGTFASPPPIGNTTPNTGAFTTLTSTGGALNGTLGAATPSTIAATTITATGTITPSQTAGIVGTTTNNNANAGSVGEYLTTSATGVNLTSSGVSQNVLSVSLTAGDWDVFGNVQFNASASATFNSTRASTSTVSATLASSPFVAVYAPSTTSGAAAMLAFSVPYTRLSLAATTTVFMVANAAFNVSTVSVDGYISARRVR